MEKYKINECLELLTYTEYKLISRLLPKITGVSHNTIQNYRKIQIEDIQDIPYRIVRIFEVLFDLGAGDLANYKINAEYYQTYFVKSIKNPNSIN